MTMRDRFALSALVLVAAVSLGACGKKEPPPPPPTAVPLPTAVPTPVPFKVASVDLGKSIGDDKKVKDAATTFGPKDTIYAVVSTEGVAAKATLKARWTYGAKGTLVNEEARDIAPTGPAVTEFHVAKASGWPAGHYKVEVSADGTVAATKEFDVKK
jgi:predicted small lipoprotein YifL